MSDPSIPIPELPSERTISRLVSLVVPFAAVGADDVLNVIVDQNTPVYREAARLYEKLMGFPPPPIVRGIGWAPIPRPERLYFWFGEPIDTRRYGGRYDDTAAARALRGEVKRAILVGIQSLRDERDEDPNRSLLARLAPGVTKGRSTPWSNELP